VEEEENWMLMDEVTKVKLLETLQYFQKYKIPGPNAWSIDFYMGFYELVGEDVLQVVEESRASGHIHAPLNSIFIALIPK
jgi:hypothetical protein